MFERPGSFYAYFVRSQFRTLPYPTQDCTGKTIIITGANVGLGLEAARHFVRLNATNVILGCRSVEKGEAAKADIEKTTKCQGVVEVWQIDLSSYESVKEFCRRADKLDRLDAVVENAGVAHRKYGQSEGHESTITVNVISTFLMALLMFPVLRKSATKHNIQPNLVIVSSDAHFQTKFKEQFEPKIFAALDDKNKSDMMDRYPLSKLLEVFVVRELAKKMTEAGKTPVTLDMLNPGFCHSELAREATGLPGIFLKFFKAVLARTTEMGSRNYIFAATAPADAHGKYFSDCVTRQESTFVVSNKGGEVQKKVYTELMEILDNIEPGVTNNI